MHPAIPGIPERAWFKSSYSGAGATERVEAAFPADRTAVRDSKEPGGPVLTFAAQAWAAFLGGVKARGGHGGRGLC